ncbi:MAG: nucleotidyltransferase family protein [Bryobacteraceae bacterium]
MNAAGLILAGGASTRMGAPKALLDFDGETFLDRLIRIFSAECSSVTVVLGHDPDTIQSGLRRAGKARFTINPRYESGQLSSLQCGLREVPEDASAVLFMPVDYPGIEPGTVRRIVSAFQPGDSFVVPRFEGRRGHPILFSSHLIPEFLALRPEAQARDVVHRHVAATRYLDTDDPCILRDVDDREAYAALLRSHSK